MNLTDNDRKPVLFNEDQVYEMLIEFALSYHKNPIKDISNDASEYLTDKILEELKEGTGAK